MPFRPGPTLPDFTELKSILVQAKQQVQNPALFQTILRLIDALTQQQKVFSGRINALDGLIDSTTTTTGDSINFPVPGMDGLDGEDGETFFLDSAAVSSSSNGVWQPLTNGDVASPELIFAAGDVIMVEVFY
jgi:hypothetical protein